MDDGRTAGNGTMLTLEGVLGAPDLNERVVMVEAWGGSVRIRGFSKRKQLEMRRQATVGGKVDEARVEMLMFIGGVVEPEFGEEHYELLMDKSAGAVDAVLVQILEISGLTKEAQQRASKRFRE